MIVSSLWVHTARCAAALRLSSAELACSGGAWYIVGGKIGISREWARKLAKRYAEKHKLPWPVPQLTKGFLYYQSKCDGATWAQIAYDFDEPYRKVFCTAYRWAKRNQMDWPP